jgi:hypothetical protein
VTVQLVHLLAAHADRVGVQELKEKRGRRAMRAARRGGRRGRRHTIHHPSPAPYLARDALLGGEDDAVRREHADGGARVGDGLHRVLYLGER